MNIIVDKGPDCMGRMFEGPYYVAEWRGVAPGWFVWGRHPDYGGRLRKVVARPDVKARRYKHWDGPRERGWWTKWEAQQVADLMNTEELAWT